MLSFTIYHKTNIFFIIPGKLKEILDHFKEHHPLYCNINSNTDIHLKNMSATTDDRFMYLIPQGKLLFTLSIKIDTCQKMAYWAIQHIGSKRTAQQHSYEIQIISTQDLRRKVTFADQCFSDAFDINEIFRQGKCGIMPLKMLPHFIKDGNLLFRFDIIKHQGNFRNRDTSKGPGNVNKQTHKNPTGQHPTPQFPVPSENPGNNFRSKSPFTFKGHQGQHQGSKGPNQRFKRQ